MKKYALTSGSLFGFGVAVHFLNKAIGTAPFSQVLIDHIPVLVTWVTISITFALYILDDYHQHGKFITKKTRLITNDAYELLKISLYYQLAVHLFILYPVPRLEALIAIVFMVYYLVRFKKA